MENFHVITIALLFLCSFFVLWTGICWLTARLSGWEKLAKIYATNDIPNGKSFRFLYGRVGWVNYNGILFVTVNSEGFFLQVFRLFQFRHSTLFIPWNRVRILENRQFLWLKYFSIEIMGNLAESVCRIELPEKVFQDYNSVLIFS